MRPVCIVISSKEKIVDRHFLVFFVFQVFVIRYLFGQLHQIALLLLLRYSVTASFPESLTCILCLSFRLCTIPYRYVTKKIRSNNKLTLIMNPCSSFGFPATIAIYFFFKSGGFSTLIVGLNPVKFLAIEAYNAECSSNCFYTALVIHSNHVYTNLKLQVDIVVFRYHH